MNNSLLIHSLKPNNREHIHDFGGHVYNSQNIPLAKHEQLYEALCSLPYCVLYAPGRFLYSELFTLDDEGDFYILGHNPGGDPDKHPDDYPDSLLTDIRKWGVNSTKPYNAYLYEIWPPWCNIQPGNSKYQLNAQTLCDAIGINLRQVCASNLFFVRSEGIDSHEKWRDKLIASCLNNSIKKECNRLYVKKVKDSYNSVHWRVHKEILELVKPRCIIAINTTAYNIIRKLLGFKQNKDKTLRLSGVKNRGKECNCYVAEGKYPYKDRKDGRELSLLIGLPDFSLDYPGELKAPVWNWVKEHCSPFIKKKSEQ